MPRVKLKCTNSKDPRKKNEILGILARNDIYVTKIIPVYGGFVIITGDDTEWVTTFDSNTCKEFFHQPHQNYRLQDQLLLQVWINTFTNTARTLYKAR